jgi:hypothetical protein
MKGLEERAELQAAVPVIRSDFEDPWCSMIFMDAIKASRAAAGNRPLGLEWVRATADRGC